MGTENRVRDGMKSVYRKETKSSSISHRLRTLSITVAGLLSWKRVTPAVESEPTEEITAPGVQNEPCACRMDQSGLPQQAQAIELCPATARCRDVMLQWVRGPITAVM